MAEGSGPLSRVGRYVLCDQIASGGMASIHIARLLGPVGFSRTLAIKRLHPHLVSDRNFAEMFIDEARLAARIRHPNVVATVDVVETQEELLLVMEYVHGASLARLVRAASELGERVPVPIALAILTGALHGLHAAHEARDDNGALLEIVHRDVSPHNIMVGRDGVARIIDFGVAKAEARLQTTRDGGIKGKLAYMAPEQLNRMPIDRRADVFAASTVLWEALTGQRLFGGHSEGDTVSRVLLGPIVPPSSVARELPRALDTIVMKGLARDLDDRFATAHALAAALEAVYPPARQAEVGDWVERLVGGTLREQGERIAEIERTVSERTFQEREAIEAAATATIESAPASDTSRDHTMLLRGRANALAPTSVDAPADDATDATSRRTRSWRWMSIIAAAIALGATITVAWARRAAPALGEAPATSAASGASVAASPPVPAASDRSTVVPESSAGGATRSLYETTPESTASASSAHPVQEQQRPRRGAPVPAANPLRKNPYTQ